MTQDIRWQQRFNNYQRSLMQLSSGIEFASSRELNDLEKQGMVQAFEFMHELAWKVMKDFLHYQGNSEIFGSRDATRESLKLGLITEGELWMDMINSRNLSSQTYDESTAAALNDKIINHYGKLFLEFEEKMVSILKGSQQDDFNK